MKATTNRLYHDRARQCLAITLGDVRALLPEHRVPDFGSLHRRPHLERLLQARYAAYCAAGGEHLIYKETLERNQPNFQLPPLRHLVSNKALEAAIQATTFEPVAAVATVTSSRLCDSRGQYLLFQLSECRSA